MCYKLSCYNKLTHLKQILRKTLLVQCQMEVSSMSVVYVLVDKYANINLTMHACVGRAIPACLVASQLTSPDSP